MRTKTVLENVDELFRAAERNRAAGDDFPFITGTLVFDGNTAHLEDSNIEWQGLMEEVVKECAKRAGFDLHWT